MPSKRTSPSYITLKKKTGIFSKATLVVPANRAARRAYKKQNRHEFTLPPVLYPYVKDANATEKGKK